MTRSRAFRAALAVAWTVGAGLPSAAAACPGAAVGDKDFALPGVGLPHAAEVRAGKLTFTVPAGQFGALLDAHPAAVRAEFCADVSAPPGGDDRDAGLAFWATRTASGAPHDFYAFSVGPRGNYTVQRAHDGHVHLIASGPATKPSSGGAVAHEIRVKVDGRRAVLLLDGAKLASFEGAPPSGTAYAGIFGEAAASEDTPWTFADLHTGTH